MRATELSLPPAFLSEKNFKNHMLNGAPTGSFELASESGWMNADLFSSVMEQLIKNIGSSKENPTLFICDHHDSHLLLKVLHMAKEAGVTILTLPPHSQTSTTRINSI